MNRRKKRTKPTSTVGTILTRHYGSTGSPKSRADAAEVLECLTECEGDQHDLTDLIIGAISFVIVILAVAFFQL